MHDSMSPSPSKILPPTSSASVLLPALADLGISVLLFGVVFLSATVVLVVLATPDRFPVRIGDRVVRLSDLESEQKALLSRKVDLQSRRSPATETRAPVLHQLSLLRSRVLPVGPTLLKIEDVRRSYASGTTDPISLLETDVSGSGTIIRVTGEVKASTGQSIRTLASFVDALRSLPLVVSVSEPEYAEHPLSNGVVISSFSIILSLAHAGQ